MSAAYNGDADELGRLLTLPCDIDAQDTHGISALMYAAMLGHTPVVQRLIESDADLELQSAQRFTALMYAVRGGHGESGRHSCGPRLTPTFTVTTTLSIHHSPSQPGMDSFLLFEHLLLQARMSASMVVMRSSLRSASPVTRSIMRFQSFFVTMKRDRRPNQRAPGNGGIALQWQIGHDWSAVPEHER
jgi:hypothetical protein